jgi:hypothetical protein
MHLGRFSLVFSAITISLAGAASACTYHQPVACGFGAEASHHAFRIADLVGAGYFQDSDIRSAIVSASHESASGRHGRAQALAGFNFSSAEGGGTGAGASAARGASSPFDLHRSGETGLNAMNVRLALNSLIPVDEPLPAIADDSAVSSRATPLPASWTMMLFGLALLGAFGSWRKFATPAGVRRTLPVA